MCKLFSAVVLTWVANLGLEVGRLGLNEVPDTGEVSPLHVSVEVHLDNTISVRELEKLVMLQ